MTINPKNLNILLFAAPKIITSEMRRKDTNYQDNFMLIPFSADTQVKRNYML